jgi:hypothetical protein
MPSYTWKAAFVQGSARGAYQSTGDSRGDLHPCHCPDEMTICDCLHLTPSHMAVPAAEVVENDPLCDDWPLSLFSKERVTHTYSR